MRRSSPILAAVPLVPKGSSATMRRLTGFGDSWRLGYRRLAQTVAVVRTRRHSVQVSGVSPSTEGALGVSRLGGDTDGRCCESVEDVPDGPSERVRGRDIAHQAT